MGGGKGAFIGNIRWVDAGGLRQRFIRVSHERTLALSKRIENNGWSLCTCNTAERPRDPRWAEFWSEKLLDAAGSRIMMVILIKKTQNCVQATVQCFH